MNRAADFRRREFAGAFIAAREDSRASRVQFSPGPGTFSRSGRRRPSARSQPGSSCFGAAAGRKPDRREAAGQPSAAASRPLRCDRSRRERGLTDGRALPARAPRDARWHLPWRVGFLRRCGGLARQEGAFVLHLEARRNSADSNAPMLLVLNLNRLTAWEASNAPSDPNSVSRPAGTPAISAWDTPDSKLARCPASRRYRRMARVESTAPTPTPDPMAPRWSLCPKRTSRSLPCPRATIAGLRIPRLRGQQ